MAQSLAPAVFFTHGAGPLPALNEPTNAKLTAFLRDFEPHFDSVRGIVIFTAHWANDHVHISSAAKHSLYFDYDGFPAAAYEFEYPASGDPSLAKEVQTLLAAAGFASQLDSERGWDHGVFIPMLLARPKADKPIVQVSIMTSMNAAEHIAIGEALQSLREKGIAIVGSGASFHNMDVAMEVIRSKTPMREANLEFERQVREACWLPKRERNAKLSRWEEFPLARFNYPIGSEDHFMPLCVASGAGADGPGKLVYEDVFLGGSHVSAFTFP